MSKFVEKVTEGFAKIPGVAYVIALVTLLYAKATGINLEESWAKMLLVSLGCIVVHWASGFSDELYKALYDADRKTRAWVPFRKKLNDSRDEAARNLFAFDAKVTDYTTAARYITGKAGIYHYASAVAKQSERWDGKVKLLLDLSKASRAISLVTLLVAIAVSLRWVAFTSDIGKVWLQPGALLVATAVTLVLGFLLRAHHQIGLYKSINNEVAHLHLTDGRILIVSAATAVPL